MNYVVDVDENGHIYKRIKYAYDYDNYSTTEQLDKPTTILNPSYRPQYTNEEWQKELDRRRKLL